MSKPLIVMIPHSLGKEEATRRLKTGIGRLHEQFGDKITQIEDTWTGDHLDFRVSALGQGVTGGLDVMDRAIEQLHGLDQRLDAGIGPLPDYGASGGMRDAIV